MPLPLIAPLVPLLGALLKLILLGSIKFVLLLLGMFLAPIWTEKKMRQFTYRGAYRGLKALHAKGDIAQDAWETISHAITQALAEKKTRKQAREILKEKIKKALSDIWTGLREVPADTATLVKNLLKKIFKKKT